MAHIEKLSIALTPEMAAVIRQCVESGAGRFAGMDEIKAEARQRFLCKDAEQH